MYGTGRGVGVAAGAGGLGTGLAMTGFPVAALVVLGLVAIVLGLALVRFASVRGPSGDESRQEVISTQ